MFTIPSIRISSSGATGDEAAGKAFSGVVRDTRRAPNRPIRIGLGDEVAEYAIRNPEKTVREVAEHFDTSRAYVRTTEGRKGFKCARVNERKGK